MAWIEISDQDMEKLKTESPPVWVAWIEIGAEAYYMGNIMSPPVWVAWIEIQEEVRYMPMSLVATRMGGVD